MILPPLVIDVRVKERDARGFRIWFPFVLLWPLLIVIGGFVLTVSIIVDVAMYLAGARYHYYTLLLIGAMGLLAETRGTHAHVNGATTLVDIDIY